MLGWMNLAVDCVFNFALVPNNREGTEESTRNVVEGSESVLNRLGHVNATCLNGAV